MSFDLSLYQTLVTWISAVIALSALWLLLMMVARMVAIRDGLLGADVAAIVYVGSTVAVFSIIALRYGAQVSPVVVVAILGAKALATTTIAVWAWMRMRREHL